MFTGTVGWDWGFESSSCSAQEIIADKNIVCHNLPTYSGQNDLARAGSMVGRALNKRSCDFAGNTNWGGRLSTVDFNIKVTCFIKKEK